MSMIPALTKGLEGLLRSGAVQSSALNKIGSRFHKLDMALGLKGPAPLSDKQEEALGKWQDRFNAVGGTMSSFGSGVKNVLAGDGPTSERVGGALSSMGDKAMATGNPVGMAVGLGLKLTGVLTESIGKLAKWTKQLDQANMAFAPFSSAMSVIQAKGAFDEEMFNQQRGDTRALTAGEFKEKTNRLDRQLGQADDMFHMLVKEPVAGLLSDAASWAMDKIGFDGKLEATDTSAEDWMNGFVKSDPGLDAQWAQAAKRRPKELGGNDA